MRAIMMRLSAACLTCCVLLGSIAAAPFPDPPRSGVVVDSTSTLSRSAIRQINAISNRVKQKSRGEIAVAVIPTTRGRQPRRFATDLFNHWKIGDAVKDNGVLVFVAMKDRKAEIILGDGIDGPAQIRQAEAIMSDFLIPNFKRGKPEAGILAAVREIEKRFFARTNPSATGPSTNVPSTTGPAANAPAKGGPSTANSPTAGTSSAGRIAGANSADAPGDSLPAEFDAQNFPDDGELSGRQRENDVRPAPAVPGRPAVAPDRRGGLRSVLMLLGGGLSATGIAMGWRRFFGRNRPRNCSHCRMPMVKLSETEDDRHLEPRAQLEERIGSVDYDVWSCVGCDHVEKVRYNAFFTRYARCPECRGRTKSSQRSVISAATTYSSGVAEITEDCRFCDYHRVTRETIPRVVESASSSSSGDSSFGGGSSSGGGASGSW